MRRFNAQSLKDLLLLHELTFIFLILIAIAAGGFGIHLRDQSFQESRRIHALSQEIQLTRGDLYRQMKELFDAFLLDDANALKEYQTFTQTIAQHFVRLRGLAQDPNEIAAIENLEKNYQIFVQEAPQMFRRYQVAPNAHSKKSLYHDMETTIFHRYELVSQHAEHLLALKQTELRKRLKSANRTSNLLFLSALLPALALLFFSRIFLNKRIVQPIRRIVQATQEISAGELSHPIPSHQTPLNGVTELTDLASAINKMASDLSTSQEALIRTEKQAAIGLLVPMLAHNIRNPLASIRATAQVMDEPEVHAETHESLQGIIETVDRLERWTSALLAYLLPIKPALREASLASIVQSALDSLTLKQSEKHIHFKVEVSQVNAPIQTDEHLLEQVIYNLVLNAIEASPMAGEIEIFAQLHAQTLVLHITDQGTGMPFIPDARATSPGPSTKRFGTGLGIPFAFKVCEVLGGKITFDHALPHGTRIRIALPQN